MPKIYPTMHASNIVIQVNTKYSEGQIALISDVLPDVHCNGDNQCFPLYLYNEDGTDRRSAVTEEGLEHFRSFYEDKKISSEALFYYIYGILHSDDYRKRFADNLNKELPRIPRVKTLLDFFAFSKAGRDLADLHLDYERVAMYPATVTSSAKDDSHYRIVKMKHPKVKVDGKSVDDLSSIVVNNRITVSNIPTEAYDYVVNGKSAIKWVMERQQVKTDKASGIVNDPNDWAVETMENAKYPLELLLRVITVSVETMKIVKSLPRLQTETDD